MANFRTPPFWGGAEEYGADKVSLPLPRPKFRAPGVGDDRDAVAPVLDEPELTPLPPPVSKPAPLSEPKMPSWTTSDEIRETLKSQPRLERAGGWKGVLQAIGERYVDPAIMHPKYAQQARDYEQKMGGLTALKKLEDQDAEQERRRIVAEAQMSADRSTEAFRNKQIADMDKPAGPRPLMNTQYGPFDPNKNEYIKPPDWAKKEGKETPAEAKARREKEVAGMNPPLSPTASAHYILTGKIPNERRGGGGTGGGGKAPANAFRVIESEKARSLAAVETDARKAVDTARQNRLLWSKGADGKFGPDPAKMKPETDRIYAELEKRKQQIQNDYEAKIASAGGDPSHFEYSDVAPQPQDPGAQTGGGKVKMVAPNGVVKEIDNDPALIKHYESLGAKRL